MVEDMRFIYVPVLKKDISTFEVALNYIKFLTKQDVSDLLYLLKQVAWTAGIEAALKSKAV